MAAYDVSPQRQSLLADTTTLSLLPAELLRLIQTTTTTTTATTSTTQTSTTQTSTTTTQSHTSASFLDAIAQVALLPRLTAPLFAHFEPLFADICARWLLHSRRGVQDDAILAAFARVLPLAPYLSVLLDKYLSETAAGSPRQPVLHTLSSLYDLDISSTTPPHQTDDLLRILVVLWRLLSLDGSAYAPLVPAGLQTLFGHASAAVRSVAIRIFCLVHAGSDFTLEALLAKHVPGDAGLVADLDGREADYTFLPLYEHTRCKELHERVVAVRAAVSEQEQEQDQSESLVLPLTPLVSAWGRSVIPRPASDTALDGTSASKPPPLLVQTATTLSNLESLAKCLQKPEPILLRGLPGAGKTSLVREAARELGMEAGLVTLHLNEQTDAKTLIGLYSTDAKPGSFKWRPGILTAAVQDGRWVLIEDLDRAPNEVMSTILPLIERRELLIPSRRETIKAPRNFRIFATVRTTLGLGGQETTRTLLGERLWQQVAVQALPGGELRQVVEESFPGLRALVPDILGVFEQLTALSSGGGKKTAMSLSMERPMTLRDLVKWCRRLVRQVTATTTTLSETALVGIFLDAVDCFAGSVKDERVRHFVGAQIAQALRIAPGVAEHALTEHEPPMHDGDKVLTVGRATLKKPRRGHGRPSLKSGRPFATTAHARRLLEQIAVAVSVREPLLLVGETGIGKTTVVQQLAESMGHKLVVVNLSQQSEVGDLLGGFKPVNARTLAMPLKEEFEDLFAATGISADKNEKYLKRIGTSIARGRWADVCRLWQQAPKMFDRIVEQLEAARAATAADTDANADVTTGQPAKRRKTESKLQALLDLRPRWTQFAEKLTQFEAQVASGTGAFAFAFVEGKIVQAVRNGDWMLLDEINLASADTLESIADLLASGPGDRPSILLSETGELDKIEAHADFRVFGAMNPATDVGKRDLPIGLRSRFTELYVSSPDRRVQDLVPIIKTYLRGNAKVTERIVERVARLYLAIKGLADEKRLVDGANEVPHYSLRTLTRVLRYVDDVAPLYGLERALVEGFSMGFLTLLSQASEDLVMPLIVDHLLVDAGKGKQRRAAILAQAPKTPSDGQAYVRFVNQAKDRQYWLLQGAHPPQERDDYIRTAYVERNLLNLVRATSTRRFPILIQGPTSAGKTSMIEYLAQYSGNKFVRINNHEHTDLQEYLGTYVSGPDGTLTFHEGVLVQAMRQGHWIVLDELNLAPTDVLEALNRLLDDNRELLVPETQEVVRPHASFMLFATQNPPGLYGGRKVLSRAFRNRFLELHFDDIPEDELGFILQQRCRSTAPSDCERIVAVYKELSRLRQTARVFEQKNSFATLRDLFRWGLREADNREQIAAHGFMLLAERVRDDEERMAVKGVIEKIFKVTIDLEAIYGPAAPALQGYDQTQIVWTKAMRRLFVLVTQALKHGEPVLLVGETGCGKTTVCQMAAEAAGRALHIVNAHQNTETGDLIGSQRPVRNRGAILASLRSGLVEALTMVGEGEEMGEDESVDTLNDKFKRLPAEKRDSLPSDLTTRIARDDARSKALFEWSDGSLVHAMRTGSFFLLDEISLADDSVLERLNSVLEPQRTLLLAEKGGDDDSAVVADEHFQFLATMNPGGDFGKKELSPALRNRFTEIWVPPLTDGDDVLAIVAATLLPDVQSLAAPIVAFAAWFGQTFRASSATPFSIRDILVLAQFVNQCSRTATPAFALVHGAATVFIDTLGANPSAMVSADAAEAGQQRRQCLAKLGELLQLGDDDVAALYGGEITLRATDDELWAGDFCIARTGGALDDAFEFEAPTTKTNLMRVVRALQMSHKPVLLEGNPGVGKTTLVSALARACGRPLTRINLSDQTDLMDLFGTDVPVEGAAAGHFAWRDAPFLQAMQQGEWVLLDEMNLASQTVLEGLNACLDHRGEVYVAELDATFRRHPDFRLFAAQNPHHQGGGRKGLPSSFVNRFLVVYADVFSEADQLRIAHRRFPGVEADTVRQITAFVAALERAVANDRAFGLQGAPWEFNLRDTLRWLELAAAGPHSAAATVTDYYDLAVRQRFRTARDRADVDALFAAAFGRPHEPHSLYYASGAGAVQAGFAVMGRNLLTQPTPDVVGYAVAPRLPELESLLVCVQHNLPVILVGPSGSGKSVLLQHAASLAGKPLVVFPLSADVDAMDLVGGFEQADPVREVLASVAALREGLEQFVLEGAGGEGEGATSSSASLEAAALLRLLPGSDFARIADHITRLAPLVDASSSLAALLAHTHALLQQPLTLDNPRFEWLDSVIVQAAQAGHWLVLDNANLCNASVLDRLNSLLERPAGFLSINEHSSPDGSPRVVALHPEFHVFLTVDPRYGELSRAMRNRSVEIFMEDVAVGEYRGHVRVEARMERFLGVVDHVDDEDDEDCLWLDNLTLGDANYLQRFIHALEGGLRGGSPTVLGRLRALLSLVQASDAQPIRTAMLQQGEQVGRQWDDAQLVHDQPLHPLQNTPLVKALQRDATWLAVAYERYADVYLAREALQAQSKRASLYLSKLSSLTRLERSSLVDQVAAVKRDSTAHAFGFLANVARDVLALCTALASLDVASSSTSSTTQRCLLNIVWHFWQQTSALASQTPFDEARFQAHLGYGRRLLEHGRAVLETSGISVFSDFVSSVAARVEDAFAAGFQLTTGLSIDVLWPVLRPLPIPDHAAYTHVVGMEALAARFDNLKWRVPSASVEELGKVMTSLAEAYRLVRGGTDADVLVNALADEIGRLEALVGDDTGRPRALPLFADIFEAVRQLHVLYGEAGDEAAEADMDTTATLVLSDVSTFSQLRLRSAVGVARQLQAVDHLLSQAASAIRPWSGTLSSHLLRTCDATTHASTLASLRSLERELPLVAKVVARAAPLLVADPVAKLGGVLWELVVAVAAAHDASLKTVVESLLGVAANHPQLADVKITPAGLVIASSSAQDVIWPDRAATLATWPAHVVTIFEAHLLPSILALAVANSKSSNSKSPASARAFAAVAWVQFALGSIQLFTPDKVFDPYLKWQTEHDFDASLRASLEAKAEGIRRFDREFLGQDASPSTSLRLAVVTDDLAALDDHALASRQQQTRVYRPPSTGAASELARLQRDVFNPVLDVTVKDRLGAAHYRLVEALQSSASSTTSTQARQELHMIQGNVGHLVERLLASFSAYQDLAVPVANLLRCLQLGLSLSGGGGVDTDTTTTTPAMQWLAATPLLDGRLTRVEDIPSSLTNSWEFLLYGSVCSAVDGPAALSDDGRRRILETFHHFFDEWKRKLVADQKAEEDRNNLYRFRGSFEDEEEMDAAEFAELFPTFDEEVEGAASTTTKTTKTQIKSTWDLSADVARVHGEILQPVRPATDVILDFCKHNARRVAREVVDPDAAAVASVAASMDGRVLPATMLTLDGTLRDLAATATTPAHYNFYADTNLPEARLLVALLHDIQLRFRSLQRVDEIGHLQPILDVLVAADHVLEVGFSEPLARVIPRVEKLHEFLYEWQSRGHAPRQYLAPQLYDRTTATLVRWRKLELSTWSRLFDAEETKCRQDAGAWWFVAYEAAVAGPMSILRAAEGRVIDGDSNGPNVLAYHAEQLLTELSAYLASSIAGQYAARLDLLRQILAHVDLLVADYPAMRVIRSALAGLVAYYARFTGKAATLVATGRAGLQKKMNDVLLLASWRDTNIEALRESARRSHQKLFRLVRKFRAVLGQPMGPVIQQGLPDDNVEGVLEAGGIPETRAVAVKNTESAVRLCEKLPGWGTDPHTRRLASVHRLVGIMASASAPPAAALDVPGIVAGFLGDLLANASALRKETPTVLSDDTKDAVKHLKVRKTRLFDETVKAVRQMGFTSNLSVARVAAQASLEVVFARHGATRLPQPFDLAGLEYAFHKLLDIAPHARKALYDHHADLQHTVARRCVGYTEGILFVALQQRELLVTSADSLALLDGQVAHVDRLGVEGEDAPEIAPPTDHARAVRWLVAVLRVASHLVGIHGRLAAASSSSADYRGVQSHLNTWTARLDASAAALDADPALPAAFASPQTLAARKDVEDELAQLAREVDEQIAQRPELAYVLRQIQLWAGSSHGGTDAQTHTIDFANDTPALPDFADETLTLSKLVLNAVQKLQNAMAGMPTSTDDPAWLVDHSAALAAAVKALHVDTVARAIQHCIDKLRSVHASDASSAATASALLRLVLPLLQQYTAAARATLLHLAAVHRATCQLGHRLGHSFVEVATRGFCTPAEAASNDDATNDTSGKLEEGTGLGEGEGADDISKDIQPDEDLSELAQTANQEKDKDKDEGVEDEKDAVDMGDDDMEGEMGSVGGDDEDDDDDKKDDDNKEEEDDMDEEAGDVDDLDPTAVDEKMWDGEDDAKDSDKEQQGNEAAGQKNEEDQGAAADEDQTKAADEQATAGDEAKPEAKEADGEDEKEDGEGDDDGDDADDDAEMGSDDEEAGPQQELNRQDQNVDQEGVLDLPDDMQIDDDEEGKDGDDDFDNLEDLEGENEEEDDEGEMEESKKKDRDDKVAEEDEAEADEAEDEAMENLEVVDGEEKEDDEKEGEEEEEIEGEGAKEEADEMDVDEDGEEEDDEKDEKKDAKDSSKPAPNDVQSGVGQEQDNTVGAEDQPQDPSAQNDKNNNNNDAKRDQGDMGQQDADDQDTVAGGDGQVAKNESSNDDAAQETQTADEEERQPFKKLGDVLERWHKTRQEIKQAEAPVDGEQEKEKETTNEDKNDNQAAQHEFQHLHDEDAQPTTQAMGAADDEEAKPLDDSMAIEDGQGEAKPGNEEGGEEEEEDKNAEDKSKDEDKTEDDDKQKDDADDADDADGAAKTDNDGRTGASMQKGAYDREEEEDDDMEDVQDVEEEDEEEDEDDLVTSQLLSTHLDDDYDDDDAALMSMDDAVRQWSAFQTATHALSLSLAAQLRLILTPSQATRLSGGFRTGKRLSIRKIIPYIASGYKRDKIWMRRAVPTKRAYQILLCVDDSKSMGGARDDTSSSSSSSSSSPGHLALSSLVMVGRALSMLEAGQVGVLGFGARVFSAHALDADQSFGAGSGGNSSSAAQTLRRFTFQQDRTDVALLLRATIDRFTRARQMNAAASSSADLWQLALILSDGLTPSAAHERIRVLLREAAEARIMVVFVVLDGSTSKGKDGTTSKSDSVLDLKEAKFVKDASGTSRVVIERYLDTFPFPYYLIVHHLEDLPAALSGLLRTWFAEVNA